MTVLQSSIAAASGAAAPTGYQIERSLRFNSADSAYLSWTPPQAGNRRTWTWSGWVKRSTLGVYQTIFEGGNSASNAFNLAFNGSDTFEFGVSGVGSTLTTAVFRDVGAWFHLVFILDTTQATAANRAKLYINNVLQSWASTPFVSQNTDYFVNSVAPHAIGRRYTAAEYIGMYLAEVNFIDGQALTPSDFGETASATGVWIPKAYTGSYGNNGFYLPFNDNSTVLNLGRNRQTLTADPYFPYTTLLLNGNQPAGVTDVNNIVFKDSSSNNFTITRSGATNNTTQGTFSPFSQTGWSNYFASSSGFRFADSADFSMGTNAFTIECFVYLTKTQSAGSGFISQWVDANDSNSSWQLGVDWSGGTGGNKFSGQISIGGTVTTINDTTNYALNTWHHVVLCRSGSPGTTALFVNGVRVASSTVTGSIVDATNPVGIGVRGGSDSYYQDGVYISNVRVVNGTDVYGATNTTLTVPTAPLTAVTNTKLLTCQSNRFLDTNTQVVAKAVSQVLGTPSVQAFSPFTPTAAYSAATNGGSGYFDGSGDYLAATIAAIGTSQFTYEAFVYPTTLTGYQTLFDSRSSNTDTTGFTLQITPTGTIEFASNGGIATTATITAGQWSHICVTRGAASAITVYINAVSRATGTNSNNLTKTSGSIGKTWDNYYFNGYISGARLVIGSANAPSGVPIAPPTAITNTQLLLNFTNAGIIDATGKNVLETVGNAQISTTQSKWGGSSISLDGTGDYLFSPSSQSYGLWSNPFMIDGWFYFNSVANSPHLWQGGVDSSNRVALSISAGKLVLGMLSGGTGGTVITGTTTIVTGQWYHIAVAKIGTTFTLYLNGLSEGTSTSTNFPSSASQSFAVGFQHFGASAGDYLNGYVDDFRVTKFARATGNFTVPQAQFAYNQADINVKQWVPTNLSVTAGVGNDSLVDSPTNYGTDTGAGGEVRGNYATANPLKTAATLSDGNLQVQASASAWQASASTIGVSSGKWYWEAIPSSAAYVALGVATDEANTLDGYGSPTLTWTYDARAYKSGNGSGNTAYGASYTTNDVIGVALDADAGTLVFYKNGISQGTAFSSGLTGKVLFAWFAALTSGVNWKINFGQRPFAYTAPSGFKALCTTNLTTPAIGASASTLANKQFDATTYTGTGSALTVTNAGSFQPDLVWYKDRSAASSNALFDAIRGVDKWLTSNGTDAEATISGVSAFNSNGFSLGTNAGGNFSGRSYVAWQWNAGNSSVSNTSGSITSTVRANQTAGISVVTYTGTGANATVGHGLGVAPKLIIFKDRTSGSRTGDQWPVYHASLGATQQLYLHLTGAAGTASTVFNNTAPTSSVFSIGTWGGINYSGDAYVAYAFAEVAGFSKFGSYTGNGNADGPFVYCGFRPRFILIKGYAVAGAYWIIIDTVRDTYNVAVNKLGPNVSDAENSANLGNTTQNIVDVLSNGFKLRSTTGDTNNGSQSYVFAAFAESPFNYSRAR